MIKKLPLYILALMLIFSGMGAGVSASGAEESAETGETEMLPDFTAVENVGEELINVDITWDETPIAFTVADTVMRWDPEELCWVEDADSAGRVRLVNGSNVRTLTVTNYSEEALTVSVAFTPDGNLPEVLTNAYEDITVTGDPAIPAAESEAGVTIELNVTVHLDLTDVKLPPNAEGGALGSFTVSLQKPSEPSGD